jgi:lysophospholipase L1-like esterase
MLTFKRHCLLVLARGLAVVTLLALGVGCSGGGPNTDFGDNDPDTVVALGDSITFGIFDLGVDTCDETYRSTAGYSSRLGHLTGKTVMNEGICGEQSSGGLARIESVLKQWRPGVVLIDYSPNDIFSGVDATISNLRAMIKAARANQTVPILGTLVPAVGEHAGWESFIEALNPQILALCAEEDLECADHHTAFTSDAGYIESPYALLSEDGLHPNAAGYTLMAETWRQPLMRLY